MNDRRLGDRPSVDEVVTVVAALALTAIGLVGFRSSYGGTTFFLIGMIGAVVAAVLAVVLVRLRVPWWGVLLIGLAAYAVVGGVVALPERATAGFLPSLDTIELSLTKVAVGWKELITITPPIGRTADLMVLPIALGFWSVFASVQLGLRWRTPWPVILPAVAVLALSIATGVDEPVNVIVQGALFGGTAIAWLAWREHRRRPLLGTSGGDWSRVAVAAAVLVVAFAGGQFAASALPLADEERDIWRDVVTPPFDPRDHPSPLAAYRSYVKEDRRTGEDPVMFTIEGLPEDVPIRLATMDSYDGLVWQVSAGDPEDPSLDTSGSFVRVGSSVAPDFDGPTARLTVVIQDYSDVWVPDVGEIRSLTFDGSAGGEERDRELNAAFRYNRTTDTAATNARLRPGDRYEMDVVLPPAVDDLTEAEIVPQVPRLGPAESVSQIAQFLLTAELLRIDRQGAQLQQVRDDMVENGVYSDGDAEAGQLRSEAGHSQFRLAGFVNRYPEEQLLGNAEQYAAAYALLFRDLRLPTRVVMGFVPEVDESDGVTEVLASDVEAWVEVPVQDVGWVAIMPTPPRDQISRSTVVEQQPDPEYRTQNPEPPPLLEPEFDRPATAEGEASAGEEELDETPDAAPPEESSFASSRLALAVIGFGATPFLVLVVAMLSIVLLKRRRSARRRASGTPKERIAAGWNEVTDHATDAGRALPLAATRLEAAATVGPPAVALAERADAATWGSHDLTDADVEEFWGDVEQYLAEAHQEVPLIARTRRRMSARSLRRTTGSRDHSPPDGEGGDGTPEDRRDEILEERLVPVSMNPTDAADAVSWLAREHGYTVAPSGPHAFRFARELRPRWATVLAIVLFPVLGVGLLFLLVRRRDRATALVLNERDGVKLRVVDATDAAFVDAVAALAVGPALGETTDAPVEPEPDREPAAPEVSDRPPASAPADLVEATVVVPESVAREPEPEPVAAPEADATVVVPESVAADVAPDPVPVPESDATVVVPESMTADEAVEPESPADPVEATVVVPESMAIPDDEVEIVDHELVESTMSVEAPADPVLEPAEPVADMPSSPAPESVAPDEVDPQDDGDGAPTDVDEMTYVRPDASERRRAAPELRLADGSTIEIGRGVVIGRDPDPSPPHHLLERSTVTDTSVSRTHAAITPDGDGLRVTDLGSTNGTAIIRSGVEEECEPGQPSDAAVDDVVRIGDLELLVVRRG